MMNNNKKHLKISQLHLLIIGFMLLLSACSPASETQEPTPPAPAASQTAALPTATDTPQNTQALPTEVPATPTLTATATPSPTPTPPPVYQSIDEQYITIGFPEYRIDSDTKDGVTVWLYKEITGLDDTSLTWFQFPTTYYSIFINPHLEGVYNLQVQFTVYTELESSSYVSAGLFPPDASYDTFQNVFQPDWSEDVVNSSYTERIVNPDSSRTYHIEIPYSAFQSGKYQFVLRFGTDVQASNPEFSILVSAETDLDDVFLEADDYTPSTAPVLSPEDEYAEAFYRHPDMLYMPFMEENDGDMQSRNFPFSISAHMVYTAQYSDGSFIFWQAKQEHIDYKHPGLDQQMADLNLFSKLDINEEDVLVFPEEMADAALLSYNEYYIQEPTFAFLRFIYERMLDEETNLIRGIYWIEGQDFDIKAAEQNPYQIYENPDATAPEGQLIYKERRNYAAVDFLQVISRMEMDIIEQQAPPGTQFKDGAADYYEDYQLPGRELFERLAQGVADNEIVEINGEFYYAPEGVEFQDDGAASMVVNPEAMGNSLGILNAYNYLKYTLGDDTRAHRLLLGYSNTFSLMLEMQEQTPTNLFPERIHVDILPNGTKTHTPVGEFNISNDFIIQFPEHFFALQSLYMVMQWVDVDIPHQVQYMPGDTPLEKWENYVYSVEEQTAAFELIGGGYDVFINLYDYWKTYGLVGSADFETGENANYKLTPAQGAAWYQVGYIMFDEQLRGEALKAMNDAFIEVADYYDAMDKGGLNPWEILNDDARIALPQDAPAFLKDFREESFNITAVMLRYDPNYDIDGEFDMRRILCPFGYGVRLDSLNSFLLSRWLNNKTFFSGTPMPEYLIEYMELIGLESGS